MVFPSVRRASGDSESSTEAAKKRMTVQDRDDKVGGGGWGLLVVAVIVRDNELRFQLRLAVTSQTATTISQ